MPGADAFTVFGVASGVTGEALASTAGTFPAADFFADFCKGAPASDTFLVAFFLAGSEAGVASFAPLAPATGFVAVADLADDFLPDAAFTSFGVVATCASLIFFLFMIQIP